MTVVMSVFDLRSWVATRGPAVGRVAGLGMVAFCAAVLGTAVSGIVVARSIDDRVTMLIQRFEVMDEVFAMSRARRVSGPGGLGRMIVIPLDETGTLKPADCPTTLTVPALCLSLSER